MFIFNERRPSVHEVVVRGVVREERAHLGVAGGVVGGRVFAARHGHVGVEPA